MSPRRSQSACSSRFVNGASVRPPFQLELLHDRRGDFLDRFRRRIRPAYAFARHQFFRLLHFVAAILQIRVLAVGPTLVADLPQPLRCDGQAVQFAAVALECGGQAHPVEVLRNERAIRRANSASRGSRKPSKKSSTNASALRTVSRISALTSVVNTTGRPLPETAASLT